MGHNATAPTLQERWAEIKDFPGYLVSDWGRVMNADTGRYLALSTKPNGLVMVGLMCNRGQAKRSLTLLVANAFVPRPNNDEFDTPINLDGDRTNNHYDNLMWRPLWFARQYMRQFDNNHTTYDAPIEDVETHQLYANSISAAIHNGLLDHEICLSMLNNSYVWPTGQIFRKAVTR
jgi:hypothetical protein